MTKAVILAGGKGTRLRPLTYAVPKPLLPINERPMLEHIILHLKNHGIREFIITVGYLGYQIKNYFRDGSDFGVKIEYAEEKEPLGTAGCLLPIKDKLTETFLLYGGDNVTTMDISKFLEFHKKAGGIVTVALSEIEIPIEYGVVEFDENNVIQRFREKPKLRFNTVTMIMAVEPRIFEYIEPGFSNITDHVFPKLLEAGEKIMAYPFRDFWLDVGRPDDYQKVNSVKFVYEQEQENS